MSILPLLGINAQSIKLHNGHSHNDYEQNRPLFDALSLGFISVEVDVIPLDGELKVSHNPFGIKNKKTIEELYLKPLDSIVIANKGTVFPSDSSVFTLMIELKLWKKKSIPLLKDKLDKYEHLFYKKSNGVAIWGPIRIVMSGRTPLSMLSQDTRDYLFLDGRIGKNYPDNLSDKVIRLCSAYGSVKNKENTVTKIEGYVNSSEAYGRKVRFWDSPDEIETWKLLDSLGVHWIDVDNLKKFSEYRILNPAE